MDRNFGNHSIKKTAAYKGFAKKGLTEFYLADGQHGNNGIYIELLCCQSPFFAKPKLVACKLMTNVNYFKRHWDETTGEDLTDSWGLSTYYFETDDEFNVTRQMQLFENGKILKYHTKYLDDEFGGLSDKPLDIADFEKFRISNLEFEKLWQTSEHSPNNILPS